MKALRKTKIVGTIGPASENKLEELGIKDSIETKRGQGYILKWVLKVFWKIELHISY